MRIGYVIVAMFTQPSIVERMNSGIVFLQLEGLSRKFLKKIPCVIAEITF